MPALSTFPPRDGVLADALCPMSQRRQAPAVVHVPVLRRQVVEQLDLRPGITVVDATVGAGGHSRDIIERISPGGRLVGMDRDPLMLGLAARTLSEVAVRDVAVEMEHSSYVDLPEHLAKRHLSTVDRLLADLGLSSDQLADESRGFSFRSEGPLDLRFDVSQGRPASVLLNELGEQELSDLFERYGEERHSREVARAVVHSRRQSSSFTPRRLAELVAQVLPGPSQNQIHSATRVFQALRIAVNDELRHVERLLDEVLPQCLVAGGRAVLISFHSLEDRLIKQAFRRNETWELLTRKPIVPTPGEIRNNPRSRSAKLRVAIRK